MSGDILTLQLQTNETNSQSQQKPTSRLQQLWTQCMYINTCICIWLQEGLVGGSGSGVKSDSNCKWTRERKRVAVRVRVLDAPLRRFTKWFVFAWSRLLIADSSTSSNNSNCNNTVKWRHKIIDLNFFVMRTHTNIRMYVYFGTCGASVCASAS